MHGQWLSLCVTHTLEWKVGTAEAGGTLRPHAHYRGGLKNLTNHEDQDHKAAQAEADVEEQDGGEKNKKMKKMMMMMMMK